ncbi:MAG: hypothetical protein FWE07_00595 [Turicibacter sp.]|nr:hypothetical protein [Turicibacter sp.]
MNSRNMLKVLVVILSIAFLIASLPIQANFPLTHDALYDNDAPDRLYSEFEDVYDRAAEPSEPAYHPDEGLDDKSSVQVEVEEEIVDDSEDENLEFEEIEELTLYTDEAGLVTAEVSTWTQFQQAMGNRDVQLISLQNNIVTGTNTAAFTLNPFTGTTPAIRNATARTLIIEGNGYIFDIGNSSMTLVNETLTGTSNNWDITFRNINLYHGNYYGFMTARQMNATNEDRVTFRYHNVRHVGNQIIHSPRAHVFISGEFSSTRVTNYTSAARGTNINMNRNQDANFYVRNVTLQDGANVTLHGYNAGNIHVTNGGNFVVGSHATLTTTLSGTPFWLGTGAPWWEAEGNNIFVEDGNIIVHSGAILNLFPVANFGAINITGANNRMEIHPDATVNITQSNHSHTHTNTVANHRQRTTLGLHGSNNRLEVYGTLNINLHGDGANGNNIVHLGSTSHINIRRAAHAGSYGQMNIRVTGRTGMTNHVINITDNAQLNVQMGGKLDIDVAGRTTGAGHIINVGNNSQFHVEAGGIFDVRADGTSADMRLIQFGTGGSFRFADAERIHLQRRSVIAGANATNNGLIGMAATAGFLEMDIQEVSRWPQGNFDATPPQHWLPMYGMRIAFPTAGTTVAAHVFSNATHGASLTTEMSADFRNNFQTHNTQRVLFERIPEVEVAILSVATDNVNQNASRVIHGVTNPHAYVRLGYHPYNNDVSLAITDQEHAIPSPVTDLANPNINTTEFTDNFTVQADEFGSWSFTIPPGRNFTANSTITAFAFLNGKYGRDSQVVLDETAPKADPVTRSVNEGDPIVLDPNAFIQNIRDTNPRLQNFVVAFSNENSWLGSEHLLASPGTHAIFIDLWDEAGNHALIRSELIVVPAYTGSLILSVPTTMSFGTHVIGSVDTRIGISSVSEPLGVTDTRIDRSPWELRARMDQDLFNPTFNSYLPVVFQRDGIFSFPLSSASVIIDSRTNDDANMFDITSSWLDSSNNSGLYVDVRSGAARIGAYRGSIRWSIINAP